LKRLTGTVKECGVDYIKDTADQAIHEHVEHSTVGDLFPYKLFFAYL